MQYCFISCDLKNYEMQALTDYTIIIIISCMRMVWTEREFSLISRNGPYIGGHLAFYFKLNFKQVYNVLKIGLIMIYVLRKIIPLTIL